MPVSVVVGGQFGSEGKGKVAHFIVRESGAMATVRVGGPNSGHTVTGRNGEPMIFRQLPTACVLPTVKCFIPAGSYVDVPILTAEIERVGFPVDRLFVDPYAVVITEEDKVRERYSGLQERIGSTGSGTGAAVGRRIGREANVRFAKDEPALTPYITPIVATLRDLLSRGGRVVIEGTQGFGLSLLHGEFPYVTSRDTTAAAFVSEAGVSPLDVDEVVLVIRAFPIRVPGQSGKLRYEIDWSTISAESGSEDPIIEHTSVTHGVRRVARFDPEIVRAAIAANRPTKIVLNHLDYIDKSVDLGGQLSPRIMSFVEQASNMIGRHIDYLGLSPALLRKTEANEGRRLRPVRRA